MSGVGVSLGVGVFEGAGVLVGVGEFVGLSVDEGAEDIPGDGGVSASPITRAKLQAISIGIRMRNLHKSILPGDMSTICIAVFYWVNGIAI